MKRAALLLVCIAFPCFAAEQETIAEGRRLQMETLRAEVASQIQLKAFDLIDELVFGWTQQPVFPVDTPVVLADVSVPVGFGSGLRAMIENHFNSVVVKNPRSHVVLAHCPECTAIVVRSGAKGTIVARGVDQPQALSSAGTESGSKHALFLDFEAEGTALVMRVRITSLTPQLPIIYARTLSSTTSQAALLRESQNLKSAEDARKEYVEALKGNGAVTIPIRIGARMFAYPQFSNTPVRALPFVWLMGGAETGLTQARAWTASFALGGTWVPQTHTGFMAQARLGRLLTGSVSSLTRPDLYAFVGGSVTTIYGLGAALFRTGIPDLTEILAAALGGVLPMTTFGGIQVGLELKARNRMSISVHLEAHPSLNQAEAIGTYFDLAFLRFQSLGVEVAFAF